MNDACGLAIRNHAEPCAIYKEACLRELELRTALFERAQDTELLDKVLYNARITVNTDERCATHVLHYTYTVTLWSLAWANESPLRIVKLARRNELPCLLNGRTNTPQV